MRTTKPVPFGFACRAMPFGKRRGNVPEHGYCSTYPADSYRDAMVSAGAGLKMIVYGEPFHETIVFHHEKLYAKKYRNTLEPPRIAHILPEVRKLLREGKSKEAALLSVREARKDGYDERLTWFGDKEIPHSNYRYHPAFQMKLDTEDGKPARDYLRTLDFNSSEAVVRWKDEEGEWIRKSFVSIPEKLCIQLWKAPEGSNGISAGVEFRVEGVTGTYAWDSYPMPEGLSVERDNTEDMLLLLCRYDPEIMDGAGYGVAVRVVRDGGAAFFEKDRLVIRNAQNVLLITRIERMEQAGWPALRKMASELEDPGAGGSLATRCDPTARNGLEEYYESILEKNRLILGEQLGRSSLFLDCADDRLLSTEELLALQHGRQDLCPALLEKLYDLGRYFLITESSELPPAVGQYNINVNLQVCSGNLTNLPEAMEVFFGFIEARLTDFRLNAKHIFGCRGILADIHPDMDNGLFYHFSSTWPHHYWVACAGWIYNEFWGHYLATGDLEFLRNRVIPGLREIALFFEDYLSDTDENGNYLFYPGFSPENCPSGREWSSVTINACMDIMVCREVLENLIAGCHSLGIADRDLDKWQGMLDKLPPYLLDEEGALKEWAWPQIPEEYNHRHVSHHYDVWPGNGITWEDAPELAEAVLLSNRKRGQENDSAHGILHRLFTAIRLKDREDAYGNLKQILEHGFLNRSLMSNHYPYLAYFPDVTGSLPAVLAEMLVYSGPGTLEFLPAVPRMLTRGELTGICSYASVRIERLEWNLEAGSISAELRSLKNQSVVLRYRYGLKSMDINGARVPVTGDSARVGFVRDTAVHLVLGVEPLQSWKQTINQDRS